MDAIANFSEHVVETGYGDLSSAAVAATKTFLLDTMGVAVAGSAGPWVEELVDCLGQCWGTAQHASAWVGGARMPVPAAALANAYQIHNSEFDCIHEAAVVHPMATVAAATLAIGVPAYRWPVFNVADSAVTIGACILLLGVLRRRL